MTDTPMKFAKIDGVVITDELPEGTNTIGKVDQGKAGVEPWLVDIGSSISVTVSGAVDQGTGGTSAWKVDGSAVTQPVSGTFWQATQPISAAALPLPSGAATAALQTQPGVDIGDVTVNNASGASAVNIQDGGNSITVDGTVAIGAGSAVIGHVISDSGSTTAVTGNVTVVQATGTNLHAVLDTTSTTAVTQATASNLNATVVGTGTFVTQATLAAETTKVIGTVNQGTSPWVTSNAVTSVIGGGTEAAAQRVTIANDSTGLLSVDDNGGSLSVDWNGTQPVTGSGTATGALRVELPTNGTGTLATVSTVSTLTNITNNNPSGSIAQDGAAAAVNPLLMGGYASAAAPADVSADNDAVRAWHLRNGAAATVLTAAGALIGGDATNGLDIDVTRLPSLVAGSALIGKVGIDQTTPGTTNAVSIAQIGATTVTTGAGASSAGTQRVITATDSTIGTVTTVTSVTGATINNGGGGSAVNIQDGGNTITVDGTVSITGTVTTSDSATQVDDAPFTPATSRILITGATYDDVATDSIDEGDAGAMRMSANRNLYTMIRDGQGNERGTYVDGNNRLTVSVDNNLTLGASREQIGALSENEGVNIGIVNIVDQVKTRQDCATSSRVLPVTSSTTNATLIGYNSSRVGFSIFNDSSSVLYAKWGASAASNSYTVQVGAGGFYESPFPCYRGQIDGIWATANGTAYVTETYY